MIEIFETVAKAMADPTRIRILKLLESGELCVCQITTVLGLASATVSKHLSQLKKAGLLQQRRDGKWVYYRLAEKRLNTDAPRFLALIRDTLQDDPTIAEDRALLGLVNQVALPVLCQQGRAALPAPSLSRTCCENHP